MCGIAGILAAGGGVDAVRERAGAMAACLEHRGPDSAGVEAGPGWALGMRRLAVQDTSAAGRQPMRLRDLTLVLNGEIYNFGELRTELERHGYAFGSRSDTEVALAALDRWGPGALARFNGMFALALVDERRRTALLARDRFGKKPLFVARLSGGLHFASELKSLLHVARSGLSLCRESLASYFRFQYVPAPRTIFREVEKLPPASWVEVDLDSGAMTAPATFWSLPEPQPGAPAASPEEVRETIHAAVRRRLVADVPVGAFLSGGVDSSLVVAGMRAAEADVRTFSIGFADPRYDESRYARAVAERLGTRHTHRQLEWRDAMQLVPSLATSYDEPFADSSALPMLAVSRLAREDVTVALSGDGGDELFGGYLRYRAGRAGQLAALTPAPLARALHAVPGRGRLARRARLFGSLATSADEGSRYRELVSVWRSPELRRLMPGTDERDGFRDGFERDGAGRTERMMRCDARTYLVDDILQKVDRASMSVGLEARNPLLDPDVVAVALRSVEPAEARPGAKPLLRDALRMEEFPDELVDRPKMGFGVPVGAWMRDGLRPLVEDLVLGRDSPEYDAATARAVVEAHVAGRRDMAPQVWALLVFEALARSVAAVKPEVLFFAPYAGPLLAARAGIADAGSTGGAETQLLLIAQALRDRGRRVALAVADVPPGVPDVVDGIDVVRLPPFGPGGRRFLRFALAAALDVDAEVIVQRAAGSFTGLVGVPARLRRRRFVYSTASDLDFDPDLLSDGIIAPRLFRLGVRVANAIVVQTDAQAELCRSRWRPPCTVIRSVAEPAPARTVQPDTFLWIGRMARNKRPEAVVELAARLPDARFRMVLAGTRDDTELGRGVRERAATLPNVELLGPQSRDALMPLVDRAVAVLSTSHAEGMPNVLLEGWARGVPALVLAHDPDGLVRRNELGWSADGSPERLVELAAAAWERRADQAELSARCRAYVAAEHAPNLIADRWVAVLGLSAPAG